MEEAIKRIESDLYEKYYKANPDGDARYDLWPDVINAKKKPDPISELNLLYDKYGLEQEAN